MLANRSSLTAELGFFVAGFGEAPLSSDLATTIKLSLVDCLGVTVAGAQEAAARVVRQVCSDAGTESSLIPGPGHASARSAALINGTAAHCLDYDDVAVQGHISAVLMPAIIAEAEALALSGQDVLRAYIVGYEVWAELIGRQLDQLHRKGWHPTGVHGPVAAAGACAYLRGLTAEQSAHALAIAASHSAGLVVNFGTMTKPLHVGNAAQAGLTAARLAQAGATGAADALEGPKGLLAATSFQGRIDLTTPIRAGRTDHIEEHGLTLKKYPTCLSTQRPIEGALRIRNRDGVDLNAIERIEVSLSRRNAEILHAHAPRTVLEAKFSLEFAVAAALSEGRVGLRELDEALIARPGGQALMHKVVARLDEREDPHTGYAPYDEVTITTTDGRQLCERVQATPGSPGDPLSEQDVWTKFCDCLDYAGSGLDRERVFAAFMQIDRADDIRSVTQLLASPSC